MNWKTLFNPFSKFSETQLLICGLIFMIISFFICYQLGYQMDSIFHYTYIDAKSSMLSVVLYTLLSYCIGIAVLFILGKIFNKRTRLIDIINTVLISQIPGVFIILIGEISFIKEALDSTIKISQTNPQNILPINLLIICCFAFLTLLFAAYGIVLLFNGFKTATNIKNWQQIVLFIFVVFVTTIVSQLLI